MNAIPDDMCPVNLTNGHYFPWWLWITGEFDDGRENRAGINELFMVIDDDGRRCVIVDTESGYCEKSWSRSWPQRRSKLQRIPHYLGLYSALRDEGPDPSFSAGCPNSERPRS